MIISRLFLTFFVFLSVAQASTNLTPFNQKAFEADKATNKVIVLHFVSSGCGICKLQQPILEALAQEKALDPKIVFYQVNVDGNQDEQRLRDDFRVRNATIVVIHKNKKETLMGHDPKMIEAFIQTHSPSA